MKFTAAGDAIIQKRIPVDYKGFKEISEFVNQGDAKFFNLETTLNKEGECFGNQFSGGTYIRANPEVLIELEKICKKQCCRLYCFFENFFYSALDKSFLVHFFYRKIC